MVVLGLSMSVSALNGAAIQQVHVQRRSWTRLRRQQARSIQHPASSVVQHVGPRNRHSWPAWSGQVWWACGGLEGRGCHLACPPCSPAAPAPLAPTRRALGALPALVVVGAAALPPPQPPAVSTTSLQARPAHMLQPATQPPPPPPTPYTRHLGLDITACARVVWIL
jgi:hypothetical protein